MFPGRHYPFRLRAASEGKRTRGKAGSSAEPVRRKAPAGAIGSSLRRRRTAFPSEPAAPPFRGRCEAGDGEPGDDRAMDRRTGSGTGFRPSRPPVAVFRQDRVRAIARVPASRRRGKPGAAKRTSLHDGAFGPGRRRVGRARIGGSRSAWPPGGAPVSKTPSGNNRLGRIRGWRGRFRTGSIGAR